MLVLQRYYLKLVCIFDLECFFVSVDLKIYVA